MTNEELRRFNWYSWLLYLSKDGTGVLTDDEKADYHELMKKWLVDEGLATPAEVSELGGYYA